MDKICIVKLRKGLPALTEGSPVPGNGPQRPSPSGAGHAAADPQGCIEAYPPAPPGQRLPPPVAEGPALSSPGKAGDGGGAGPISFALTEDQIRLLQANPRTAALLGAQPAPLVGTPAGKREAVVLRLEVVAPPPLKLLKTEEVQAMLRISRSCLNRIVGQGSLRSYRLGQCGRLRRFRLEDILAYLEEGLDKPGHPPLPGRTPGATPQEGK